MNIFHIKLQINNIINNKSFYDSDIVLYGYAVLEMIDIIIEEKGFCYDFIRCLKILDKYFLMDNKIDYDFLDNMVQKNMINIFSEDYILTDDNTIDDNCDTNSSENSVDINKQIEKMLKEDNKIVNFIVKSEQRSLEINKYHYNLEQCGMDDYGEINKELLDGARELFKKFDFDADGYLSAIDIIHLMEVNKNYPFIFINDLEETAISLFEQYKKIDFEKFYFNFI